MKMTMALINMRHEEIAVNARGRQAIYISFPNDKDVYFTSAAATHYGLKGGMYLHFDNTDGKWSFFQSEDPDGFFLHADQKKSSKAVRVINKALVRMFRKSTQYKEPVKFMLLKSGAEVNGKQLIDIVTHKTYDMLVDQI